MKTEPIVDYSLLKERITSLYRFTVQNLSFVPEGECSIAYIVEGAGNQRYFLKLWPGDRQGLRILASLAVVLPILDELCRRDLVTNLPAPVPAASGALYSTFSEYALALFPYIQGQPAVNASSDRLPPIRAQIAQTMARLHEATQALTVPLPRKNAFAVDFGHELRGCLDALSEIGPQHSPEKLYLRDLLLPQRNTLLNLLDNLQAIALLRTQALVLCHTDMGGNNVLVDVQGSVFILDWDELILAPAEFDLQQYRGEGFADFLSLYREAGGTAQLSPVTFRFYLLRRYLGDLTDWLVRILRESTNPEQDRFDIQGIEDYCLAYLANFEAEMTGIANAIK